MEWNLYGRVSLHLHSVFEFDCRFSGGSPGVFSALVLTFGSGCNLSKACWQGHRGSGTPLGE